MKFMIFHCWGGDSRGCWRGWLADELKSKGYEVVAPDFPGGSEPELKAWLSTVRKTITKFDPDDKWVFIGHSLGCPTILRVLESFDESERVDEVILVAGFAKDLGISEIAGFVDKDFDWEKIRKKSKKFVVISSDNDPFIELEEGKRMAGLLNAEFVLEQNGGHINEGSGFYRYPRLLEIIHGLK